MHTKGGIDKKSLNYLLEGNCLKYGPDYIHILKKIHRLDQLVLQIYLIVELTLIK